MFERRPWLLARPHDVVHLRASLAGLGIDRFVFVTVDVDADRHLLAGLDILSSQGTGDCRRVLDVRESAQAPSTQVLAATLDPGDGDHQP